MRDLFNVLDLYSNSRTVPKMIEDNLFTVADNQEHFFDAGIPQTLDDVLHNRFLPDQYHWLGDLIR